VSDPADLSNLHDIVAPLPVPWLPPAPGWWIVAVIALGALAILAAAWAARWRRNAYRRAALKELDALGKPPGPPEMQAISAILKRAALVVYPREEVASLTGRRWLEFLDRSAGMHAFADGPGASLETSVYGAPVGAPDAVLAVARRWLRRHRAAGPA
jgi:Domain of unknown function (DUF4381)